MAYIRKLPSGKWQASVRLDNGRRVTRTASLRRSVVDWSKDTEEAIASGRWESENPKTITYKQWREKFMDTRNVEPETWRGDKAIMNVHIAPYFDSFDLNAIKPSDVKSWLGKMIKSDVGHSSQVRAFNLFRTSMKAAVLDEIISSNPADKVPSPKQQKRSVEWFTPSQVNAICDQLSSRDKAMVITMAWVGLRWGECAGLRVCDVSFTDRIVSVNQVVTQASRVKPYPKSSASRRDVPAPPVVLEQLAECAVGKNPSDLLFANPTNGRPLNAPNWRRLWYAAIEAANEAAIKAGRDDRVPEYSPHSLRHTAASWLVQAGVPLSEIQRLLGHSTPTMTNRYAHLAPGAHSAVEGAWRAMSRGEDQSPSS